MKKDTIFKTGSIPNAIKEAAKINPILIFSRTLLIRAITSGSDDKYAEAIPFAINKMEQDISVIPVNEAIEATLKELGQDKSKLKGEALKRFKGLENEDHYIDAKDLTFDDFIDGKIHFVNVTEMLDRYIEIDKERKK